MSKAKIIPETVLNCAIRYLSGETPDAHDLDECIFALASLRDSLIKMGITKVDDCPNAKP